MTVFRGTHPFLLTLLKRSLMVYMIVASNKRAVFSLNRTVRVELVGFGVACSSQIADVGPFVLWDGRSKACRVPGWQGESFLIQE